LQINFPSPGRCTMPETIKLSFPADDLALLALDTPGKGANILSRGVLEELSAQFDTLEKRSGLVGLVIVSSKPGIFIAGADLREFAASIDAPKPEVVEMCRRGHQLFGRLAAFPFVTVAAIDGICVGGGAELAAWCDRRIMSDNPKTEYGFPEVKLGLYPGWGGTVRMPRIVGLGNAVELITGGESIDARAAFKMGLVSDVIPAERLFAAAEALVRDEEKSKQYLEDREVWRRPISMNETELGFLGATASAMIRQQTKGQYPAPEAALETLLETAGMEAEPALVREAQGMAELFGSPINRSLLNVFFLTDRNKKDTGVSREGVKARAINSVGVLGAGIMGSGIAAACVKRDVPVVFMDAQAEALAKGSKNVLDEVSYNKKTKGPDAQKVIGAARLLNASTVDAELAACDLVLEAIVENIDAKKKVYARLEPQLRPEAVFASNTSTIPITKLAEGLKTPERFVGIHFFNPVRRMKLVEVIRGAKTNDETVAAAVAFAKRVGKSPIVVNDGPGFLVNRLLLPYMNEALELLCEGVEIKAVDRAAKAFGMPMGPIELYDMVGIDTAYYAGKVMQEAFPDRIGSSSLLPAMVKAQRLGQKSGLGFFSYQNKKGRPEPDPAVDAIIGACVKEKKSYSQEEITARLFLPMLLEATRVLESGVARDPRDIDLALIFGVGFPPFKGGLLFWADTLGAAKILEMLRPLAPLGKRAEPTAMLLEMAKAGSKFYR
jgi:3-hydroxyacyl-CoA dehydrogenase/enoyl-CoA hydratase/carnithine racemase